MHALHLLNTLKIPTDSCISTNDEKHGEEVNLKAERTKSWRTAAAVLQQRSAPSQCCLLSLFKELTLPSLPTSQWELTLIESITRANRNPKLIYSIFYIAKANFTEGWKSCQLLFANKVPQNNPPQWCAPEMPHGNDRSTTDSGCWRFQTLRCQHRPAKVTSSVQGEEVIASKGHCPLMCNHRYMGKFLSLRMHAH